MFRKRYTICLIFTFVLIIEIVLTGCQSKVSYTYKQGVIDNLNSFMAYTTEDESFTQEDFSKYDVVLVCFWAPWSDASLYELRRLDNLSENLPDNIGFVTVGLDGSAKNIKKKLKKIHMERKTTLISGDGDFRIVCDEIENIPTTILLDHKGTIIGKPIIGIQNDLKGTYLSRINKVLKSRGKDIVLFEEE